MSFKHDQAELLRHIFFSNVKEHAPPLATTSVETGVKVHDTGDVDDKAASGGCSVSSCYPLMVQGELGHRGDSLLVL